MTTKKTNPRRTNSHRRNQIRNRLIARAQGDIRCALCGKPINPTIKTPHPQSLEVDEIIPISHNGSPYDINNCQLTHRACNQTKSNKIGITHISHPAQSYAPIKHSQTW